MSEIAKSFASLVKSNNGAFKSEKQAAFLLSQCEGNSFTACASMYGNSYDNTYVCDSVGVVRVEHYTKATGTKIVWERVEAGKVSVQESKEFKRISREIKRIEKSISEREAAKAQYVGKEWLYAESMAKDIEMLNGYRAKL